MARGCQHCPNGVSIEESCAYLPLQLRTSRGSWLRWAVRAWLDQSVVDVGGCQDPGGPGE
jgi:hypothetical protein